MIALCDLVRREKSYQNSALWIAIQSKSDANKFEVDHFTDPDLRSVFVELQEYWEGKRKSNECKRIAEWLKVQEIDRSGSATAGLKKKLEEQRARKEAQDQMMKLHRLAFG